MLFRSCAFIALVFTIGHGAGAFFAMGGNLDATVASVPRDTLLTVYLLGFLGFSVKAELFPFHR